MRRINVTGVVIFENGLATRYTSETWLGEADLLERLASALRMRESLDGAIEGMRTALVTPQSEPTKEG